MSRQESRQLLAGLCNFAQDWKWESKGLCMQFGKWVTLKMQTEMGLQTQDEEAFSLAKSHFSHKPVFISRATQLYEVLAIVTDPPALNKGERFTMVEKENGFNELIQMAMLWRTSSLVEGQQICIQLLCHRGNAQSGNMGSRDQLWSGLAAKLERPHSEMATWVW